MRKIFTFSLLNSEHKTTVEYKLHQVRNNSPADRILPTAGSTLLLAFYFLQWYLHYVLIRKLSSTFRIVTSAGWRSAAEEAVLTLLTVQQQFLICASMTTQGCQLTQHPDTKKGEELAPQPCPNPYLSHPFASLSAPPRHHHSVSAHSCSQRREHLSVLQCRHVPCLACGTVDHNSFAMSRMVPMHSPT